VDKGMQKNEDSFSRTGVCVFASFAGSARFKKNKEN
jgi:hypothetical protein